MSAAQMRVVVRLRPSKESECVCDPHVGTTIATKSNPEGYTFPAVLGIDSTQREAYLCCGEPMIDALLDGQQACLFAYGQTGSGKTFSLLGAEGGKNPHKLNGIVPQIVGELFRRFSSLENQGIKHFIGASFVEVHNERIRDLCDEPDKHGNQPYLGIRETKDGPVFISSGARPVGETTVPVHSSRALLKVIEEALAKRMVNANDYHEHSSRSHALLTLKLEKRMGTTSQTKSDERDTIPHAPEPAHSSATPVRLLLRPVRLGSGGFQSHPLQLAAASRSCWVGIVQLSTAAREDQRVVARFGESPRLARDRTATQAVPGFSADAAAAAHPGEGWLDVQWPPRDSNLS